jgi:hypothetical protein
MEPHHDAGEMLLPTEETAELIYKSFVDAVTSISVGYLQLIGNSPSACALQSVLIGRAPTAATTWEEFMVTRLRFDLPFFHSLWTPTMEYSLLHPSQNQIQSQGPTLLDTNYPKIWKWTYKVYFLRIPHRIPPCSTFAIMINVVKTKITTI